jgi:hypothetical protein
LTPAQLANHYELSFHAGFRSVSLSDSPAIDTAVSTIVDDTWAYRKLTALFQNG